MPGGSEQSLMKAIQDALVAWRKRGGAQSDPNGKPGDLAHDMEAVQPTSPATQLAQRRAYEQAQMAAVPPTAPAYGQARYQGPPPEGFANAASQFREGGPAIELHPLLRPYNHPKAGPEPEITVVESPQVSRVRDASPPPAADRGFTSSQFDRKPGRVEVESVSIQPVVRNAKGQGTAIEQGEGVSDEERKYYKQKEKDLEQFNKDFP